MLTREHNAFKKFGPGHFILEQLDIRNWSSEMLAKTMKLSEGELDTLLNNEGSVTEEIAQKLGDAFNTSPGYWINIDKGYREWLLQ